MVVPFSLGYLIFKKTCTIMLVFFIIHSSALIPCRILSTSQDLVARKNYTRIIARKKKEEKMK